MIKKNEIFQKKANVFLKKQFHNNPFLLSPPHTISKISFVSEQKRHSCQKILVCAQYSSDFEGKIDTSVIFALTQMKFYLPCAAGLKQKKKIKNKKLG